MTYQDSSKPITERVEHLLGLMTLKEKVGQLIQPFGWKTYEVKEGQITLTDSFKEQVKDGGVGSLYGALRADPWTGVTLETGLSPREGAGPVHMGTRELMEVDMLPFKKAVEAGAASIMPAYNEIDGIPCTVNTELMDDTLRKEWGFDGMVITDCGAIDMLASGHDTAADGMDAAVQAIRAGIDMEMSGEMFGKHLQTAIEQNKLEVAILDEAVRRVLTLKFKLGLFEKPYVDPQIAEDVIGSERHVGLARQLAAEGVVLLKNEEKALPLSKDGGVIAVIGPNADQGYNQLGDYTSPQPPASVVTVLNGIRAKLGGEAERVLYAPGCRIKDDSREGFEFALACAGQADTVVVVLGGSSARDFGEGTIDLRTGASKVTDDALSDMDCGEGIDRMTLQLSGVQLELAQEIHKLGKRMVVVYINGRPIAEPWIDEHAHAILEAWYPGQEGGHAIADILFGDVNPSGKLTLSIPKHVGQLPVYYNGKRSRGKRYLEEDSQPRYPFGYGLSYTEFHYSDIQISSDVIGIGETAVVSVNVTNSGEREGSEVVQLYVSDVVSQYTRPARELKGFRKISLRPGEKRKVEFTVGAEQLQYVGQDYHQVIEPGLFRIMVGRHVNDTLSADLTVQED